MFTEEALKSSVNAMQRIDKVKAQIEKHLADAEETGAALVDAGSKLAEEVVPAALQNFEAALRDDLSMPRAAAALFTILKATEKEFKRAAKNDNVTPIDTVGLRAVLEALLQMDRVFGIFYQVPLTKEEEAAAAAAAAAGDDQAGSAVPEEVMELVRQRTSAKEAKEWDTADTLRAQITDLGYAVKDVKGGEPIVTAI